jgi:uncharacterized membrane protein
MNFSPQVKAWIQLICLVVGSGGAVGLTSFLGGANWKFAVISALVTGASNVYHALSASPKDKAEAASKAPFPPP